MSTDLTLYRARPLARQDRQAAVAVKAARLPAKRAVARVEATAAVAYVGLLGTEALTALEVAVCKRQGAVIDDRAKAIVDCFSGVIVSELSRLALGGE